LIHSNKYIIGIDAGATSSEAVLYSPGNNNAEPRYFSFNPINFNLSGFKRTVETLTNIIEKTSGRTSLRKIDYIAAGISGARLEKDRDKIKRLLSKRLDYDRISILPDTEIAFASVFEPEQKNCGILISGTGSVLYYKDEYGDIIRIGGWGRYLGDEGSGFWIAREALNDITKNYDGRGRQTSLASVIEEKFGIKEDTILQKIYHDKFDIPKITSTVFECAEKGDIICEDIIRQAAEHLAYHLIPVKKYPSVIALCGSLFSEEKLLEEYFREIVREKYPQMKLVKPGLRPVMGAVKIAERML
jgi:N-acetylglucosamine kinase-like BadF-type ATPase